MECDAPVKDSDTGDPSDARPLSLLPSPLSLSLALSLFAPMREQ